MAGSAVVIRAFSADHVVQLTGLSKGQLRYWDKTNFFRPQFASEDRRDAYSRVYSFIDVVGLRTLAVLRKEHSVSLQHLRKVAEKLSHYDKRLWSGIRLFVLNKEVYFSEKESDFVSNVDGQLASVVLIQDIINDVEERAQKLKERTADQHGKIERHRHVQRNAWVIAGTRIPTKTILRYWNAGNSVSDILREYPMLTEADVKAALKHEKNLAKVA